MEVFVSGVNSGLGKYIYEKIGGVGLRRDTSTQEIEEIKNRKIDVIIHCAFSSQRRIDSESLYNYLEDNVLLTKKLISFPHQKFIFISSVDVYPKDGNRHSEDEIIDVDSIKGIYGITKLMSESIIRKHCENYLILRASALLGRYSRRNSLIKIIEDQDCILSLSGESRFNYVLYSDVLGFIEFSIQRDLKGIFNLTSSENITLSEVANMLGKKIKFGDYFYDVGNIDNSKILSIFPPFKKTAKEVIAQYIKERYG
jgi:nucleoside-diphosphate-sugar epimerase